MTTAHAVQRLVWPSLTALLIGCAQPPDPLDLAGWMVEGAIRSRCVYDGHCVDERTLETMERHRQTRR